MTVPNLHPTTSPLRRIALIGEAPGADEDRYGRPFCGPSGRFLAGLMGKAGYPISDCFLGNICQTRPPNNDISLFEWDGEEVQAGLSALRTDLDVFRPNITVLLGNLALKGAKDPGSNHPLKPGRYRYSNSNWRGSLFMGGGVFEGKKCIPSLHPAYCLRDYAMTPLLHLDLQRAIEESSHPELVLPQRTIKIALNADAALTWLREAREKKWTLSPDIEGGLWTMSCISLAVSPTLSYVIPFTRKDFTRVWAPDEEKAILRQLCLTMMNPEVPKIFQNGLYDRFVLQYSYHIPVLGNVDDTMLAGWELNCEIEKGLAVLTSIYTREPYYKGDRKSQDDVTFYRYCGMDGAVTYEIRDYLNNALKGTSMEHYRLNMSLLNPLLYMELRGIRYDSEGAAARRSMLLTKMHEAQARLNALTGHCFSWRSIKEIRDRADSIMLTIKGDRPRKSHEEAHEQMRLLLVQHQPTLATIGEIEDLCEVSLNVDSKAFKTYLYETLGLPEQWKENKATGQSTLTADYEALLKLSRYCQKEEKQKELQVVQLAIEIRALSTRAGMLSIRTDPDGRIRTAYNLVATDTGRIASYISPTGSGFNLQTIPNYTAINEAPGGVLGDRDLFIADDGNWMFQCDLKGADGWTVAAYAAMLGDPTMLEDYKYGLKPANILTLMLRGVAVNYHDREALKQASKQVEKDSWDYFAMKRVQHGGSYLEGEITISKNILKDSEGKLFLEPKECGKMRNFFFMRYPGIKRWQDWLASRLKQRPLITSASGHSRRFFGRPDEILTKAVADEPQNNTTYVTNLALHRLWKDPENRYEKAKLKVEPLHTVHDALVGQFNKSDTAWSISKIKQWFDNPITVAGQKLVIPFDGSYGESWGNLKEGVI